MAEGDLSARLVEATRWQACNASVSETKDQAPGYVTWSERMKDGRAVACVASSFLSALGDGTWEQLDMAGCDLSMLGCGRAPVLVDHAQSVETMIGCVEAAWIHGDNLWAQLRFSSFGFGRHVWEMVREGIAGNISIGFIGNDIRPSDGGVRTVSRWRPFEVSAVAVPASWTASMTLRPPAAVMAARRAAIRRAARGSPVEWRSWAGRAAAGLAARLGCTPEAAEAALRDAVDAELSRAADTVQ